MIDHGEPGGGNGGPSATGRAGRGVAADRRSRRRRAADSPVPAALRLPRVAPAGSDRARPVGRRDGGRRAGHPALRAAARAGAQPRGARGDCAAEVRLSDRGGGPGLPRLGCAGFRGRLRVPRPPLAGPGDRAGTHRRGVRVRLLPPTRLRQLPVRAAHRVRRDRDHASRRHADRPVDGAAGARVPGAPGGLGRAGPGDGLLRHSPVPRRTARGRPAACCDGGTVGAPARLVHDRDSGRRARRLVRVVAGQGVGARRDAAAVPAARPLPRGRPDLGRGTAGHRGAGRRHRLQRPVAGGAGDSAGTGRARQWPWWR